MTSTDPKRSGPATTHWPTDVRRRCLITPVVTALYGYFFSLGDAMFAGLGDRSMPAVLLLPVLDSRPPASDAKDTALALATVSLTLFIASAIGDSIMRREPADDQEAIDSLVLDGVISWVYLLTAMLGWALLMRANRGGVQLVDSIIIIGSAVLSSLLFAIQRPAPATASARKLQRMEALGLLEEWLRTSGATTSTRRRPLTQLLASTVAASALCCVPLFASPVQRAFSGTETAAMLGGLMAICCALGSLAMYGLVIARISRVVKAGGWWATWLLTPMCAALGILPVLAARAAGGWGWSIVPSFATAVTLNILVFTRVRRSLELREALQRRDALLPGETSVKGPIPKTAKRKRHRPERRPRSFSDEPPR